MDNIVFTTKNGMAPYHIYNDTKYLIIECDASGIDFGTIKPPYHYRLECQPLHNIRQIEFGSRECAAEFFGNLRGSELKGYERIAKSYKQKIYVLDGNVIRIIYRPKPCDGQIFSNYYGCLNHAKRFISDIQTTFL